VNHTEDGFTTPDGVRLYTQAWSPDGRPRAAIFLIHGLAEHSGRYAHVAAYLAERGYAVHGMDLRGHGHSEGLRGYIDSLDVFIGDLYQYFKTVRTATGDVPCFVLGHSMGALLSLIFAGRYQSEVAGVIVSGTAVRIGSAVPGYMKLIGQVLSRIAPKAPLMPIEAGTVSKDPLVRVAYETDPFNYRGKIRARLGAELLAMGDRAREAAAGLTIPVLLMHGGADTLADPAGLAELDGLVTSPDKTVRLYEGLYHEIFNEPEKAVVLGDVAAWLDAHSG